ncbi:MAG: winged helix-turn-helix domain-containing protein [Steroidobacteraceae bacterium]
MTAAAHTRADQAPEQGFLLGTLRIDPPAGEVTGPGGREKLDPRVMDVLVMLAQHAGQVVLREDLLSKLWPDSAPTDDVLSRCIYELRRQLGRAADDEQLKAMIETVPKRGYRLNGEVKPISPESATPWGWMRWLLPTSAAAITAALLLWFTVGRTPPASAEPESIAVLPFVDMSEGQDHGYLADGISEEILNRLVQAENLRVISRTSSFAFRGEALEIRDIAAQLGVSHVLEGSVRRSGNDIRITAQLIAASDNSHVWSETFDREYGDLFTVQDEIAQAVTSALQVSLKRVDACCPAPKPEALEPFLQGQFFYNRRSPGDIERAVSYYEQAVAIDPQYATAWAALAGAYSLLMYDHGGSVERLRPLQGEAARKAVELAPGLAVAHARLGQYYYSVSDDLKGDEHFRKAQALDPDDPLVMGYSSDRALRRGDLKAGVEIWRRLVERNPLSPTDRLNFANFLAAAGRLDESAAEFRKALELNPDFRWSARFEFAQVLVLQHRYDEAIAQIEKMPGGEARDYGLALLHQAPGRAAEADAALKRLAERPAEAGDIMLAELYASRGMTEQAFAALVAARSVSGLAPDAAQRAAQQIGYMRTEIIRSPLLKALHDDPRWAELTAEPE